MKHNLVHLLTCDHDLGDRGDGSHFSERLLERGLEEDERDLAVLDGGLDGHSRDQNLDQEILSNNIGLW